MSRALTALVFFAMCLSTAYATRGGGDGVSLRYDFLKVPGTEFVDSLKMTISTVRQVTSVVSQFGDFFGDFRVSNAISDCLDLLDMSAQELDWTLSASKLNTNGKDNSTGHPGADMRTWLSAALVNQDTCMEGFDGTNSMVKTVVAGSLGQLSSLIRNVLVMVDPTPPPAGKPKGGGGGGNPGDGHRGGRRKTIEKIDFPSWVRKKDRKLLEANTVAPNAVVATDGTGNYRSIQEAVEAAPKESTKRFVIYVKRGVYNEYVDISKKKWNIMMIGDGMGATVISGNRSFVDGWTTYRSATFAVKGRGFIARDITFQNIAGPEKHQAVAFRTDSDLSVLYRCAMLGYQDTLYAHSMRQFYRECTITGTVDFIFGDATAVFQNCLILARKGLPSQKNTITAHGRKDPTEPTGFSIQFSNITADADLLASMNTTHTYLGRPWKLYSRTVVMRSYMSEAIRAEGWLEWSGNFALDTLYYGEYMNYGPGAGVYNRVKWPGYHQMNDPGQANNFTVAQFLLGDSWLPSTGVKYTSGLTV